MALDNLLFIVQLLRVKQWVKNAFILFPLIFSGHLRNLSYLTDVVLTFLGFCFTASSIYVLNDYLDREKDRLHPKKSHRPFVRRNIPARSVALLIFALLSIGLGICVWVDPMVALIAVTYLVVQLAYNLAIKHVVILDVVFVAFGFQIRIWAGAFAAGVLPSVWLQLCVFLLALFLGFNKRRHELESLQHEAKSHRKVLEHYTTYLLDQIIVICSTLAIVFYGLYTISSDIVNRLGNHNMAYSLVFVIYGMLRYLYLVHVKKIGDDPGEVLLQDKSLMIGVGLWVIFVTAILYGVGKS